MKPKEEGRRGATKRKQTGVRVYEDTLRAVRVYAAEHDLMDWEAADILWRRGLGLPPREKEEK